MSLFNFTEIKDSEVLIFYRNGVNGFYDGDGFVKPKKPKQVLKDIETIDQLLIIQKLKSLLNKKRGLKQMFNKIIQNSISKDAISGTNNNHLL